MMSVMDLKWDSTSCSNVFVTAELRVFGLDSLRLLDGDAKSGPDALQEFCLFKGLFTSLSRGVANSEVASSRGKVQTEGLKVLKI